MSKLSYDFMEYTINSGCILSDTEPRPHALCKVTHLQRWKEVPKHMIAMFKVKSIHNTICNEISRFHELKVDNQKQIHINIGTRLKICCNI